MTAPWHMTAAEMDAAWDALLQQVAEKDEYIRVMVEKAAATHRPAYDEQQQRIMTLTDRLAAAEALLQERRHFVQHEPNPPYGSEAYLFRELMAMMHGDGGHYHAEHGRQKAFDDAVKKYYRLVASAERAADSAEVTPK